MLRFIILLFLAATASGAQAQLGLGSAAKSTKRANALDTDGYHYIAFISSFNLDDGFIGGQASVNVLDMGIPVNITLSYAQRPLARRVWVEQTSELYYQLRQRRFQIGLGAETYVALAGDLEVYGLIQGGYLFGNHKAINIETENQFVVLPEGGFGWSPGTEKIGFLLRAGYAYRDVLAEDISPHRGKVTLAVTF